MTENFKSRITKLIRLLSSPVDGERLGAVYAIERILKENKLSWHDLADTIANKIIERRVVETRTVEKIVEVQTKSDAESWIKAAEALLICNLAEHERKFIEDMKHRFRLRPNFVPSDKQTNWFTILYRTYVGAI